MLSRQLVPQPASDRSALRPSPSAARIGAVLERPGRPLASEVRTEAERRLGHDFGRIRVHADGEAASSAAAIGASAYAIGQGVAFGAGRYAPGTPDGFRLLLHELAHTVQQPAAPPGGPLEVGPTSHPLETEADLAAGGASSSRLTVRGNAGAPGVVRRAPDDVGGSRPVDPGIGAGLDLTFIFQVDPQHEAKAAEYTAHMTAYIEKVLRPPLVYEVWNLGDVQQQLERIAERHQKVRRIRLVSHGSLGGHPGSVLMYVEGKPGWVTPRQVWAEAATNPKLRRTVHDVMAPGAVVEFWGCHLGSAEAMEAGDPGTAWATLFQATFKAPREKVWDLGQQFPIGEGAARRPARSSAEVDRAHRTAEFDHRLLSLHAELVSNGEMAPVPGGPAAVVAAMRALFDQSHGTIWYFGVGPSGRTVRPEAVVLPGDADRWNRAWATFDPVPASDVAGDSPPAAVPRPEPASGAPPPTPGRAPSPTPGAAPVPSPSPAPASGPAPAPRPEGALRDENVRFLGNVALALISASQALETSDPPRAHEANRMGWRLLLGLTAAVPASGPAPPEVAMAAEQWATTLGRFDASDPPTAVEGLSKAVQGLSLARLTALAGSVAPPVAAADQPRPRSRTDDLDQRISEALARLGHEDVSSLDRIQKAWDAIAASNTQQVVSWSLGEAGQRLDARLPRAGPVMTNLSRLWVLRHVGTILLDLVRIEDADRRSARRMMFLDTGPTIEMYDFLTEHWPTESDPRRRQVQVVERRSTIALQRAGRDVSPLPGDVYHGLTLRRFGTLLLQDRGQAIAVAESVGGYVWRNAPVMGTPRAAEAMRRIDEGLKLVRDGVSAAFDVYALFNPVWSAMQTAIAVGGWVFEGNP